MQAAAKGEWCLTEIGEKGKKENRFGEEIRSENIPVQAAETDGVLCDGGGGREKQTRTSKSSKESII